MRRTRGVLLTAALLIASTQAFGAAVTLRQSSQERGPRLENLQDVLARFDAVQDSMRSFSADFVQTTENKLLKEPLTATGKFFLTKPGSVLWAYSSPEEMRFAINDNLYVGYFPARRRAEKKDVHRWSEQIFRFFGLGQGSKELSKFYQIRLEDPGDMKGSYLLVLDPVKRRVKKRLEQVKLWIDSDTFLPVQVQYTGKDGNTRVTRFRNLHLNPELAAGIYNVHIPPDVTVTTGFSGFGVL